jgi:hypothetical protein
MQGQESIMLASSVSALQCAWQNPESTSGRLRSSKGLRFETHLWKPVFQAFLERCWLGVISKKVVEKGTLIEPWKFCNE